MRPVCLSVTMTVCCLAAPAGAAPAALPTLFDVTGVRADDSLNVRERADVASAVIGTLRADARGVEVVAERGGWALINSGDRSGWVNVRYLRERPGVWSPGALPPTLSCAGTEPFWSLRQVGAHLVFETPEQSRPMERRTVLDAGPVPARSVIAADARGRLTAVIQPGQCSDGMSDRSYGLSATLVFDGEGQRARMYSGCCRVAP